MHLQLLRRTDGSYMTHIRHMPLRIENNNSRNFSISFDLPTFEIPLNAIRIRLATNTNFQLVFMPYQCESWNPCNLWMCVRLLHFACLLLLDNNSIVACLCLNSYWSFVAVFFLQSLSFLFVLFTILFVQSLTKLELLFFFNSLIRSMTMIVIFVFDFCFLILDFSACCELILCVL